MNFLKGSLFRRNTEPEELEPMEESGGGILAVWGSPGCGKTVTAVKIAKNLAAQKKNTVLLLCDMTAPMMPCICPPSELEVDKSLGSIFAAQHISVNLIKHNLTIDVCVLVVCAMLVLALAVRILPVFVAKQQLDTYAVELVREAEISGRVGTETNRRAAALTDSTGLDPNIRWSKTGRIQLNEEVTVTLTMDMDIGLFGGFGSFPVTLRSEATGKSEVYWK